MAMSDCIKCWDTPCACGYEYKDMSKESMAEILIGMLGYRDVEDKIEILNMVMREIEK